MSDKCRISTTSVYDILRELDSVFYKNVMTLIALVIVVFICFFVIWICISNMIGIFWKYKVNKPKDLSDRVSKDPTQHFSQPEYIDLVKSNLDKLKKKYKKVNMNAIQSNKHYNVINDNVMHKKNDDYMYTRKHKIEIGGV